MIQAGAKAKFEETVEVSFKMGLDPRRSDQQVRGVVSLPHGTGKRLSVAVFAEGEQAEAALKAGENPTLPPPSVPHTPICHNGLCQNKEHSA